MMRFSLFCSKKSSSNDEDQTADKSFIEEIDREEIVRVDLADINSANRLE
jgi:hypothetical protein